MNQKHVLFVDDDSNLRRVTQVLLEREGYIVSTAASGREALQILSQTAQDLVITDLRMPGISGIELLRALRTHYPSVPVIIVTAYDSREGAAEAMRLGAYDYMTKPVKSGVFRLVVHSALESVSSTESGIHCLPG